MQAVILAGGSRTQSHPLNASVPKPMIPLFDRPVMEHTLRLLARHEIRDITIALSSDCPELPVYFGDGSTWGLRIRYSVEDKPLGTAGALRILQNSLSTTFLVISGDAITDADLTAALAAHRSASAIATILSCEVGDASQFGQVTTDASGKVTRFLEKPRESEHFSNTVSTGIYVLEPEVLSCIPHARHYDVARNLFPAMLNNREPVYAFPVPGYWCDTGDPMHYRKCHFDVLMGKVGLDLPAVEMDQGVWLAPGVQLHSSVQISGPAYLGRGSVLRRSVILDGSTVIGSRATVDEESYLKHSLIGDGASVGKHSRLTDCTVGAGCTVDEATDAIGSALAAGMRAQTLADLISARSPQ